MTPLPPDIEPFDFSQIEPAGWVAIAFIGLIALGTLFQLSVFGWIAYRIISGAGF